MGMAATMAKRLIWQVAQQCDEEVVRAIARGEEIDGMHRLDYVGLFTEFFAYLMLIGLWDTLRGLEAEDRERIEVPTPMYVLIYMQKLIAGLASGQAMEDLLLTDMGAMRAVGFNAQQVEERGVPTGTAPEEEPGTARQAERGRCAEHAFQQDTGQGH